MTVVERFWAKVAKSDGCWEWTAYTSKGYGLLFAGHKHDTPLKAHRFSWELHNGPIPDGLWVLHHCDNRRCVRPDHLFLGTNADNMADAAAKGRYFEAQRRRAKLSVVKVREIKRSPEPSRILAARFGVSQSTIYGVRAGRAWRDVA